MRGPDVTVVLYRPNKQILEMLARTIQNVADETRHWWILVSGTASEHQSVSNFLDNRKRGNLTIVNRYDNIGFSAGHNYLMRMAFLAAADQVLLLNADLEIDQGAITELVKFADLGEPALYGPTIMRLGSNEQVADSLGIVWNSQGRHFDSGQDEPHQIVPGVVRDVRGVTGACLLVRRDVYDAINAAYGQFFDEAFLAYREDAELGIRAEIQGIPSKIIDVNGFRHLRAVRNRGRVGGLIDLLGVKNRFLMRFSLGRRMPGNTMSTLFRDAVVMTACLIKERPSLPGIIEAFRLRRYQSHAIDDRHTPIANGPRVLLFGSFDPCYPRDSRLISYLTDHYAATVDIIRGESTGAHIPRYFRQLRRAINARNGYDAVFLAPFALHFAPFSYYVAKRNKCPHIVDFFVGNYETKVQDWGTHSSTVRRSMQKFVDRIAAASADVLFTDTVPRSVRFQRELWPFSRFFPLAVGAPSWAHLPPKQVKENLKNGRVSVLYYGNYLPLHGLEIVLKAYAQSMRRDVLELTLIGEGGVRRKIEDLAIELGIDTEIRFLDRMSPPQLSAEIEASDIILGVFGGSTKAQEVVANKVWQGLAANRVVLTRTSPALSDLTHLCGEQRLLTVEPNVAAVSQALDDLAARLTGGGMSDSRTEDVTGLLDDYVEETYVEAFVKSGLDRYLLRCMDPLPAIRGHSESGSSSPAAVDQDQVRGVT